MRSPPCKCLPYVASAAFVLLSSEQALAASPPAPDPKPAAAAAANAHAADTAAIDPANLLLFAVDLDDLTITDGLASYGSADDPLLPVGELTRLLEMDIDVLPADRRIVGRLGQARRSLLVDLNAHVARVGAQDVPLSADDVAVTPTEIYLRASALQKLLPLKLEIHPDDLAIKVVPTELLPVQERLKRLANRPTGGPANGGPEEPALKVATPYRLFSPPSADVVLGFGVQSNTPREPLRYDLRLAGDLLYADMQAYLASDQYGQPSVARFLLERKSMDGGLLGPLHARDITLGDTFTPGLALGARSVGGRGLAFSTAPLEQTSVFNRIDLRGELPVGYDVEIYVNDVLRGQQNTPNNGRYEFLDVPLTPGVNVIRTVTYGPRGERHEETRVINVGGGLLRQGDATFSFGAVDQDVPLFQLRANQASSVDPTITHLGGTRLVADFNYGVTNFLTFNSGVALLPPSSSTPTADPRSSERTAIYTAGLRMPLLALATQFDAAADSHGGRAEAASLAGSFKGASAVLRHAEYQGGFIDENNLGASLDRTLQRRTELTGDVNLQLRGRIVPVSLRVVRNGYAGGDSDIQASWRASSSLGAILYSAGFEYDRFDYRPAVSQKFTGYLAASTFRSFSWQIRATLDFDLAPQVQARLLSVTADHRLSENWSLRLAIGEPLYQLDATTYAVSSTYHSRFGDLSLTADYDNGLHSWELAAELNFGLGYDPYRGYRLTPAGPGSGGSAVLEAYMDLNGDGVREPNEPPVRGVAVDAGGGKKIITGPDGRAYLTNLGTAPSTRLSANIDNIEDTSVKAPPSAIQFTARPGGVARINYPLQPTGGVTVMVELQRDNGQRVGLSSVKLQLVPAHGEPVTQTTEFDGSAVFDQVPAGVYRLQLDPAQAKQLRMHLLSQPTVTIKSDGSLTPDVKTEVKFDPAPDAASAAQAPAQPPAG